jgi:3',5'-cyclic AMP phosphodiesterase CpdA
MNLTGCGVKKSNGHRAAAEKPLLRFVQMNDTHISPTPSAYTLANEKLDYLVHALNAATYFPVPDFVIGLGDMVNGGGLSSLTPDLTLLKTKLAALKCPYYPVMGNHEDAQREGDAEYQAPYIAAFGADRVNYTFRAGGMQFVVVDDSGAPKSNQTSSGLARNQWVRRVFEASPRVPIILCCHIPLVPLREPAVLKQSFGFVSEFAHDDDLLKLVDLHSDRIVAVLSGHLHLTGVLERNGVHHISVSGTASYPCDFACYEVFADRLKVWIQSLPAEYLTPLTDIHGKPRHETDYFDASHSTHESYIRGTPWERTLEVRLGGRKRPALV